VGSLFCCCIVISDEIKNKVFCCGTNVGKLKVALVRLGEHDVVERGERGLVEIAVLRGLVLKADDEPIADVEEHACCPLQQYLKLTWTG